MAMAAMLATGKGGVLVPDTARPRLDLSGELLDNALTGLTQGAEVLGGVERYVQALQLKSALFKDLLGEEKYKAIDLDGVMTLSTFMSPVRRRIAPYLDTKGLALLREGFAILLDDIRNTASADQRMKDFCKLFPQDRKHFFVRDLAAEVLHNFDPERYPLMCRWVWDSKVNTGALREIWFGDEVDHMTIDVPDNFEAFIVLREEICSFLSARGAFRDLLFHSDLLLAQIYSNYICAQGGSYLRTDFSAPQDPMQYTRRLLGLDGVTGEAGRTKLKSIDGKAFVIADMKLLG